MDQTMSNALWFLGATVVAPIVVAIVVRRIWFRDEKDRFYVDANPVRPRPGADKPSRRFRRRSTLLGGPLGPGVYRGVDAKRRARASDEDDP